MTKWIYVQPLRDLLSKLNDDDILLPDSNGDFEVHRNNAPYAHIDIMKEELTLYSDNYIDGYLNERARES